MSKIQKWLLAVMIIIILIGLLGALWFFQKSDQNKISIASAEGKTVSVTYTSDELLGEYSDYTAKVNWDTMSVSEGNGATIVDSTVTISQAGTYYFTGTTSEGNIIVNADNQEVVIVLDNVNMTCTTTSVINVIDAKKVTVNIPKDTTTTLTDGTTYTKLTGDDEPNATIFSKDDLTIDGKGTLIINANYKDAVASKDGLKVVGTTIQITSADDGIRGKDYVALKDAIVTVKSKGKAIKVTEDTDTNLGFIVIDGGTYQIESEDDAIHASNKIVVNEGTFEIKTEDDGLHADSSIFINGGTIHITQSYEGIEANYIEINGGDILVYASDDGININGGNDSMGMTRQDAFRVIAEETSDDINRLLVINGGNVVVESNGDGLDSNGSIQINGGTILVGGSTNGGNAALDYNNTLNITGGTLIAYGPTGMWQNPSTTSTQYTIAFTATGKTGDEVVLKDNNGRVITSFEAKRSYGMVCFSSSDLKQGDNYSLYINGEEIASQEIDSIVTSNGTSQEGFGRGQFQMNDGERPNFSMRSGDSMPQPPEGINKNTDGKMPLPLNFSGESFLEMKEGERPERPTGNFENMQKENRKEKREKRTENTVEINNSNENT